MRKQGKGEGVGGALVQRKQEHVSQLNPSIQKNGNRGFALGRRRVPNEGRGRGGGLVQRRQEHIGNHSPSIKKEINGVRGLALGRRRVRNKRNGERGGGWRTCLLLASVI